MDEIQTADWANFFVAEVGASAALLGLLFVSISINLSKILSFRALPNRAFGALLALLAVLVVSSLPWNRFRDFYGASARPQLYLQKPLRLNECRDTLRRALDEGAEARTS